MTGLPLEDDWVGIPRAATAAAAAIAGPRGKLAVLDLYEIGHITGYGIWPWTDRQLSDRWDVSRGTAVAIVEMMRNLGLMWVERAPPGKRIPSKLRVWPACSKTRAKLLEQLANQSRSQNDPPPTPESENSQPDADPPRGDVFAHASVGDEEIDRSIHSPKPPLVEREGASTQSGGPESVTAAVRRRRRAAEVPPAQLELPEPVPELDPPPVPELDPPPMPDQPQLGRNAAPASVPPAPAWTATRPRPPPKPPPRRPRRWKGPRNAEEDEAAVQSCLRVLESGAIPFRWADAANGDKRLAEQVYAEAKKQHVLPKARGRPGACAHKGVHLEEALEEAARRHDLSRRLGLPGAWHVPVDELAAGEGRDLPPPPVPPPSARRVAWDALDEDGRAGLLVEAEAELDDLGPDFRTALGHCDPDDWRELVEDGAMDLALKRARARALDPPPDHGFTDDRTPPPGVPMKRVLEQVLS